MATLEKMLLAASKIPIYSPDGAKYTYSNIQISYTYIEQRLAERRDKLTLVPMAAALLLHLESPL